MKKLIGLLAICLTITGCFGKTEEQNNPEVNNSQNIVQQQDVNNGQQNVENQIDQNDEETAANINSEDAIQTAVNKINRDDISIPTKFDFTTINWSSNELLAKIPEIKTGTFVGAITDDGCIELFYKNADYAYLKKYHDNLDSSFKQIRAEELIKEGNYYLLKKVSDDKSMKVWIYYFNDSKYARVLVYQIGYFTEAGLSDEEINN